MLKEKKEYNLNFNCDIPWDSLRVKTHGKDGVNWLDINGDDIDSTEGPDAEGDMTVRVFGKDTARLKVSAMENVDTRKRFAEISGSVWINNQPIDIGPISLSQRKHPDYYTKGELGFSGTTGTTLSLPEKGGTVYIRAYSIVNGDPNKRITIPELYTITSSGSCVYDLSREPIEQNGYVIWSCEVLPNLTLSGKTADFNISFDYGEFGRWNGDLHIVQDEHVQVIGNLVYGVEPNYIPFSGGVVNITAHYTIDGVKTMAEIPWVAICKGDDNLTPGLWSSAGSGTTTQNATGFSYTIGENKNSSGTTWVTKTGEKSRSFVFKTKDPKTNDTKNVGTVTQYTKKAPSKFTLTFSDGSDYKRVDKAYDADATKISFGVISTVGYDDVADGVRDVPIKVSIPEEDNNWVSFVSYDEITHIVTLAIDENNERNSRYTKVSISQDLENLDDDIIIEDGGAADIFIEFGQVDKINPSLPDFDYIILTYAMDKMSGKDLDTITIMETTPDDYDGPIMVGWSTLDGNGDDEKYSLYWADDNTATGAESVVIYPRHILSESWKEIAIDYGDANNEEVFFDVSLYGNFFNKLKSGLVTIRMDAYKDNNDEEGGPTVATDNVSNTIKIIPGSKAIWSFSDYKQTYVITKGSPSKYDNGVVNRAYYTKIGTLRYTYKSGLWNFIPYTDDTIFSGASTVTNEAEYNRLKEICKGSNSKSYFAIGSRDGNVDVENYFNRGLFGAIRLTETREMVLFYWEDNIMYFEKDVQGKRGELPHLYYDQSQYYLKSVGTSSKKSVNWSDDTIYWEDADDSIPMYSSLGILGASNVVYFDMAKIQNTVGGETVDTVNNIERMCYMFGSDNTQTYIPQGVITGNFYDPISRVTSEFTINPDNGQYRTITWKDTTNGDSSSGRYLTIDPNSIKENGRESTYILDGISSFNSQPSLSVVLVDGFQYKYNVSKNLVLKWIPRS